MQKYLLEQKVGQMFITGIMKPVLDSDAISLIRDYHIGNFVLYAKRNLFDLASSVKLLREIQKLAFQHNRIPQGLAVDQEGGVTSQLYRLAPVYPGNLALAALGKPELVYQESKYISRDIKILGLNINLAPVLDIHSNYKNPSMTSRSFGDTPQKVIKYAIPYIRAHQENKVITVGKHFAGNSDVEVDTHDDITPYPHTKKYLMQFDLLPFRRAFAAGLDCIMGTHLSYPAFDKDPHLPGTLSRNVLTNLLRRELKFKGVAITDDLEMEAVAKYYDIETAARMAVTAGADMVMVCHTYAKMKRAVKHIVSEVRRGRIPESRIDQSFERILRLKQSKGLFQQMRNAKYEMRNLSVETIKEKIWSKGGVEFAEKNITRAITILRDEQKIIPLKLLPQQKLLVINPFHIKFGINTEVELDIPFRKRHKNTVTIMFDPRVSGKKLSERVSALVRMAEKADVIIIGTDDAQFSSAQTEIVKTVIKLNKPYIVVATRSPYDFVNFPEVKTYLMTYTIYDIALESAVKVILGETKSEGEFPLEIRV